MISVAIINAHCTSKLHRTNYSIWYHVRSSSYKTFVTIRDNYPLFCEEYVLQSSAPHHFIVGSHGEHIATWRAICNQLDVVLPEILPIVDGYGRLHNGTHNVQVISMQKMTINYHSALKQPSRKFRKEVQLLQRDRMTCYVTQDMKVKKFQTAKVNFKVIQQHWQWRHLIAHTWFPISVLLQLQKLKRTRDSEHIPFWG